MGLGICVLSLASLEEIIVLSRGPKMIRNDRVVDQNDTLTEHFLAHPSLAYFQVGLHQAGSQQLRLL